MAPPRASKFAKPTFPFPLEWRTGYRCQGGTALFELFCSEDMWKLYRLQMGRYQFHPATALMATQMVYVKEDVQVVDLLEGGLW